MIVSFRCPDTQRVFQRTAVGRWPRGLQERARQKLVMVDAAMNINDLRVPPGNRLEQLRGRRAGQHSIRINDQWRICLVWKQGNAHDVEIVDYH